MSTAICTAFASSRCASSRSTDRGSNYEVINLGNNHTVSLNEMLHGLEEALDVRATIDRRPEQPGDVPQTWANVDKAARLLGYRPASSYRDGVQQFVSWLRAQATLVDRS